MSNRYSTTRIHNLNAYLALLYHITGILGTCRITENIKMRTCVQTCFNKSYKREKPIYRVSESEETVKRVVS